MTGELPRSLDDMHPPARRTRVAGLLALLVALVLAPAAPASAHTELRSSAPATDEQLTTAPTQVELVFTDTVLAIGTQIVLTGPGGEVAAGEAAVDGDAVTASLPADLPDGAYEVAWRVTAEDGHPISGTYAFAYSAPAAAPAPAPSPPTASPTTDAPEPTNTPAASPTESTEQTSASDDPEGMPVGVWIALGAGVLVALGGGGAALARRRP